MQLTADFSSDNLAPVHLVVSKVTSGRKTYRYARLMQSYRRKDGRPAHKVLANLGELPDQMIENLRVALQAAREGKPVVLGEIERKIIAPIPVERNYRYLDLAVLLELWNGWRLSALFERLLPQEQDEVPPGLVVAALVLMRCVEPASKLESTRRYRDTALPELLGLAPEQFNNSRLHRVLGALDAANAGLQATLPLIHRDRRGRLAAYFLDVTDTWFEGRGCALAERSRTKEGLRNRRKVGVVLLCDDRGFPLRWEVVPGKRADSKCLGDMVEVIKSCPWVGDGPVVCDRAMGKASSVALLVKSGLRFLTAVPRNEIESHTAGVPYQSFETFEPEVDLDPSDDDVDDLEATTEAFEEDVSRARELAEQAGLTKVTDTLYVLELGLSVRLLDEAERRWVGPEDEDPEQLVGAASALAWARIFRRLLETGEAKHRAALAELTGVSRARVTEVMNLLRLDPAVQEEALAGAYGPISDHAMRPIVKLEGAEAQRAALRAHAAQEAEQPTGRAFRPRKLRTTETQKVRHVAYFNPELLVRQRLRDRRRRRALEVFVDELNEQLRSPRSRRDEAAIRAEVLGRLGEQRSLRLYDIELAEELDAATKKKRYQVALVPREEAWSRRRRYQGFVLLVGHRDLPQSASEVAELYRAKDVIERDFRTIKSVVELRPVYHYTDPKVRAHVTLCVLSLLLQRTLESKLEAAGRTMTASSCLETLATCHLNRYESNSALSRLYEVTRPTAEQRDILKALGMGRLVDDAEVTERLEPRRS